DCTSPCDRYTLSLHDALPISDHAIPVVHQAANDRSERVLMSASGESMNVFSNNPGGAELSNDPMHLPPERATVTSQSCTASCHAVVLAGESSSENIDGWRFVSSASFTSTSSVQI